MAFNRWVLTQYEAIPENRRHLYSSDTLIAAVCHYRKNRNLHPICLSESEAKAFVNEMLMQEESAVSKVQSKNNFTEKSIKENMKRNLIDGTIVDVVFDKCTEYLNTKGLSKNEEANNEALHSILIESGIIQNDVADKIGAKIIQQQKNKDVEKVKKPSNSQKNEYKEIRTYKFLTPEEVEKIKRKSIAIASKPEIHVNRDVIRRIVDEILKIIEEVKRDLKQ